MRTPLLLTLLIIHSPVWADNDHLPPYQARFDRDKPVIAVVGENRMTELVDYLVPFGLLSQAGIAEVVALSTEAGPLHLMPALTIRAQATVEEFQRLYPQGADYLIVPAVHESDDPRLLAFIGSQAKHGATLVGICDGVLALGQAGQLRGRRATGHWYSLQQRREDFPETRWVENRRYVVDGKVMTTSGVSAAIPATLAVVEAIAGAGRAAELGSAIGLADWSPRHDSRQFAFGARDYMTIAGNYAAFWRHETLDVPLQPGLDEAVLALKTDAWARSFRTEVSASAAGPVISRHGLTFLPDVQDSSATPMPGDATSASDALDEAIQSIGERYGLATAELVAAQLEYQPSERSKPEARRNNRDNP